MQKKHKHRAVEHNIATISLMMYEILHSGRNVAQGYRCIGESDKSGISKMRQREGK